MKFDVSEESFSSYDRLIFWLIFFFLCYYFYASQFILPTQQCHPPHFMEKCIYLSFAFCVLRYIIPDTLKTRESNTTTTKNSVSTAAYLLQKACVSEGQRAWHFDHSRIFFRWRQTFKKNHPDSLQSVFATYFYLILALFSPLFFWLLISPSATFFSSNVNFHNLNGRMETLKLEYPVVMVTIRNQYHVKNMISWWYSHQLNVFDRVPCFCIFF